MKCVIQSSHCGYFEADKPLCWTYDLPDAQRFVLSTLPPELPWTSELKLVRVGLAYEVRAAVGRPTISDGDVFAMVIVDPAEAQPYPKPSPPSEPPDLRHVELIGDNAAKPKVPKPDEFNALRAFLLTFLTKTRFTIARPMFAIDLRNTKDYVAGYKTHLEDIEREIRNWKPPEPDHRSPVLDPPPHNYDAERYRAAGFRDGYRQAMKETKAFADRLSQAKKGE